MVTPEIHFFCLLQQCCTYNREDELPYFVNPSSSTGINNWNASWIYELLLDAYKLNKQHYAWLSLTVYLQLAH
jgi:hypothetical protein